MFFDFTPKLITIRRKSFKMANNGNDGNEKDKDKFSGLDSRIEEIRT